MGRMSETSENRDRQGSGESGMTSEETRLCAEYAEARYLIQSVRAGLHHPGLDRVRYWTSAADDISGDFFCTAEHPRLGWCAMLGDAAGHGLASAIFALQIPMMFREMVLTGLSLPAIHQRINHFLLKQHISHYYVCGVLLRVLGRDVEVINAAMPDVLLFGDHGNVLHKFSSTHLPLGVTAEIPEEPPQRYRLGRDETASLLTLSDGLTELHLADGSLFGQAGVLTAAQAGAANMFEHLVGQITQHIPQLHDDASLAWVPLPLGEHDGEIFDDLAASQMRMNQRPETESALCIVEQFDRGLLLTDADQRIQYANPMFTTITGYSLDEVIGQTPRLLSSGRQGADFYRTMWQTLSGSGSWRGEIWNRRKDGSLFLEWLELRALYDCGGQVIHYLASFTAIDQHRTQEDRLHFLALHDSLTGMANRVLLNDRGEQALRRADRSERAVAVLFVDLDRFKSINDSLGHDIGDEVLVAVAQRLQTALRSDDTLARFGGDEFVCLLPDIADRHDAARVANKLLASLDQRVDIAGHKFKVGASIGISAYPSDGQTLDDLIVAADRAMMRAKQAGGNLAKFFSAEMAVTVERQLEMEAQLDDALRAGHLELHYQPKIDLITLEIIGAEALVRWRDPERGLIQPGVFIPVAERSDLIAKIGNWVLRETCQMLLRRETDMPAQFHVAVNVSPMQLERCDLPGEVSWLLKETSIAPARLQLEVTESIFIRDRDTAAAALQQIASLGVLVALDDFGTGYSNMGALSHLPLETFKLDQSFVRNIDQSAVNTSIARSVWHLANGLGKHLVAEGIETNEEYRRVVELGYRIGQGFRFGRPMPEAEFFTYLKQWQPGSFSCAPELASVTTPVS